MKETFRWIMAGAAGLGAIFALSYVVYLNTAFFAPKFEGIRRDVMIESRAYSEATVQQLYKLRREYLATDDPNTKLTIVASARHQFSIFPEERLPNDLRAWMQEIR